MALVVAKVLNAMRTYKLIQQNEATVCKHCRVPFITEKAIQNYNNVNAHITNSYRGNTSDNT